MSGDEWQKGLREECRVKMQGVEIKEGEGAEVAVLFPSTLAFRPDPRIPLDPRYSILAFRPPSTLDPRPLVGCEVIQKINVLIN